MNEKYFPNQNMQETNEDKLILKNSVKYFKKNVNCLEKENTYFSIIMN